MAKKSIKTAHKTTKISLWQRWPAWNILGVIFGGSFIVLIGIWAASYYVNQYLTDQADKAKFAKVETLVNKVKTDLKKAFPDKTWEIVKFCDPLKGEFGNIVNITCEYGVKSNDVIAKDINPIIENYASGELHTQDVKNSNRFLPIPNASCLTASSTILGGGTWQANFFCIAETNSFIYPEHHYPQ